ncbi:MAG: DMT family transporter [Firmicutes bacterium]|nr:DMT family transporter [Bacillota bacterium]
MKKNTLFLLILVSMLWGTAFPLLKQTTVDTPTSMVLALRFTLAGIVLTALFWRRIRENFSWRLLRDVFIVSTVQYADYFCYAYGMNFTTSINGGFYSGVPLLFLPFIVFFLDKQPLKGQKLWAVGIILSGMFLLASDGGRITFKSGDLLCLTASALFALYIALTGRGGLAKQEPTTKAALQMLCVAFWAWLTGIFTGDISAIGQIGAHSWRNIVLLGLFCTATAYSLQIYAQDRVKPLPAAIIYAAMPLFAALASMLILGERLGVLGIIGGLLIVGGIIAREVAVSRSAQAESAEPAETANP